MDQNKKRSPNAFLTLNSISRPLTIILALIIAVSFFFSMQNDFDYDIGHFATESVSFRIVIISAVFSIIFAAVLAFSSYGAASFTGIPDESPITYFGSILSAGMSFAGLFSVATDISLGVAVNKFSIIATILLPFIGISAILSLIPSMRFSKIRQICAILAVLSVNFSMFSDYFTFILPLNSPIRNLTTVMKCAIMLYLLSEARFSFGVSVTRTTVPFFVLSSAVTSTVTLGYSLGAVAFALLRPTVDDPNPTILSLALCVAIGIHAFGRILSCAKCVGEYVAPPAEEKKNKKSKETNNEENKL